MKGREPPDVPTAPAAPASLAAPTGEWAALRTGAVRAYQDEALLARVRARLQATERPVSRRPRVLLQAAAALVVFGIGVGVGKGLPNLSDLAGQRAPSARAMAEARTGAATIRRDRGPERREAQDRPKVRPPVRKRSSPIPVPLVVEAPEDAAPASDLALPVPEVALVPSVAAPARKAWLDLAERGDYAGALAELEQSQVAHLVLATGSVEELMTMAEVARFAGNQERAIQALSQVVDRYGHDPNAPLAAMMLGNLLSRAGDPEGAARAYARNRALSPGGDFAEDALVREFDLALAAANASLASNLFDQYAREFPAGPHLYAMRYELDELLADSPAPAEHAGTGAGSAGAARPEALPSDSEHTGDHPDDAAPREGTAAED
jgi:TolA-binding protein